MSDTPQQAEMLNQVICSWIHADLQLNTTNKQDDVRRCRVVQTAAEERPGPVWHSWDDTSVCALSLSRFSG
ncbi:hypothetical protein JOB18_004879 [Solea senegalensis]|uniref:Uncharacterized protein n=1 Tax=Solea senegalensis TaxID=28829 RepID=A0AAV6SCK4_SOLSE|nr:hypothetical protein JOB18_004879 [Solea senegalensis]